MPKYSHSVVESQASELLKPLNTELKPDASLREVAVVYSQLIRSYRGLKELQTLIKSRLEILKDAGKGIKLASRKMFTGTEKDKDAQSERLARYFNLETSKTRNSLVHIDGCIDVLEYATEQYKTVLIERQSQAKNNSNWFEEGLHSAVAGSPVNQNTSVDEKDDTEW
jgi:hypothetical protein